MSEGVDRQRLPSTVLIWYGEIIEYLFLTYKLNSTTRPDTLQGILVPSYRNLGWKVRDFRRGTLAFSEPSSVDHALA